MNYQDIINTFLKKHTKAHFNEKREDIIEASVKTKEVIVSECGALATWTPKVSTGRAPLDTLIVKRDEIANNVDWDSPNNIPASPELFDMVFSDTIDILSKDEIYVSDRSVGADSSYAMPIKTITNSPLVTLFAYNMFRDMPEDIQNSLFKDREFNLLVLPYNQLDEKKYAGKTRKIGSDGETSRLVILMDLEKKIGIVFGSAYMGSVKKTIFTVMNYYLPLEGILPLHCSANENKEGELSLFLGLSGTGKTTLSADASRALLGDDEHGWDENGVANFENGCYAKLIDLDPKKEPEIFKACFHKEDDYLKHGVIIENAMVYPNGKFDLEDDRITPNSRGSYPLSFLTNIKKSSKGPHPKTIVFLTADANGVLPPVSKLNKNQAMLWFLMGYTSKLAGTEAGIVEPVSTFSRFFGQPFMPCLPHYYADLLGKKITEHKADVYLINTGWTKGAYPEGKRMDIVLTRKMLNAALNGDLKNVEYKSDKLFHLSVPQSCPDVPKELLDPINTWQDKEKYKKRASKLASEFSNYFDKAYGDKDISDDIKSVCPGK